MSVSNQLSEGIKQQLKEYVMLWYKILEKQPELKERIKNDIEERKKWGVKHVSTTN